MRLCWFVFFFNDTATTEIYTLSLHDALPICRRRLPKCSYSSRRSAIGSRASEAASSAKSLIGAPFESTPSSGTPSSLGIRSEEHTSEPQSRPYLVCRLLPGKKKKRRLYLHSR